MSVQEDLRQTLLTARQAMGEDAHPIHVARIGLIWAMVQWAIKEQPAHWQQALERAERATDLAMKEH